MKSNSSDNSPVRVSVITIFINIILSVFKLIAGIVAHSSAMISDAVHSASDVVSTVVVIIGLKISSKESDTKHQYGHERMECIAGAILSVILFATGAMIGYNAFVNIISGNYENLAMPGALALWAAVVSVAVKEWMYYYTKAVANKYNSSSLMADAWHHRSDALSSIGSFVGVLGSMLGFKVLDSVAGFVISIFIIKAAFDIFMQSMEQMVDKACDEETVNKISTVITETSGVKRLDSLKTRMFGPKLYVDVEIAADGEQSLADAHKIAEEVHMRIENEFPEVKHCMVHVNPME